MATSLGIKLEKIFKRISVSISTCSLGQVGPRRLHANETFEYFFELQGHLRVHKTKFFDDMGGGWCLISYTELSKDNLTVTLLLQRGVDT